MSTTETDLALMRAVALLDSNPMAAAREASAILASHPDHEDATLLFAAACRRTGDAGAGLEFLAALAAEHADSAVIQLEYGRALSAAGHHAQALELQQRVVALEPNLADAWRELSAELLLAGETTAADVAYASYQSLAPLDPRLSGASDALRDGRLAVAQSMLQAHIAAEPDDVVALRLLAKVALRRDDLGEAERLLQRCLSLAPCDSKARFDLCTLLLSQRRAADLMQVVPRLLAVQPRNYEYRLLEASGVRLLGQHAAAVAVLDRLIAEFPDVPAVWIHYGHLMRTGGRPADAVAAYNRAIDLSGSAGEAYWSLANLKTFRFSAEQLARIATLARRDDLPEDDRIYVEFTLGKALEDAAEYESSFAHYAAGNSLQRARETYNAALVTAYVKRAKQVLTSAFFAARQGWGIADCSPIFVVGLPRSGSTLIEQILASHSQVEGTRELSEISIVATELMAGGPIDDETRFFDVLPAIDERRIRTCAETYLERTRVLRTEGKPRFIDKMPNNFAHIGFIHLMFPNASIIDARRHPLGCGFSCFRQLFHQSQSFTYDLTELGLYYRDYAELMDHFDAVLPGRVHRVFYERMVAEPEAEVRRLLDYCALPFEEQCLRFHETKRTVQTISAEQVRQPLYKGAVDHWQHYEPWLGPLKTALGDLVERYPAQG